MAFETLSEYAERVLFSESLEEKLRLSDAVNPDGGSRQPAGMAREINPGRPSTLRLRKRGVRDRSKFPTLAQLDDAESRGRLFHFFANHELMAAELMALALLRFPEAPREFREGLFETLREEQRHTRWYIDRMRECGIEFGSQPLSRYFWDTVAPMESPLDYVTRLSLTFEQANLDYTRHYAAALRTVGDGDSAALLDRIYRDEIQHVGYGLRWFRRWKRPEQSDWEAYRDSLVFPLSPSRAKGNGDIFNEAGRFEAGLDAEFVRELTLFERSKGRTPNVFWFNPDAEDAMAGGLNGGGYQANRSVLQFVRDLEPLALFLARRDDVVLVRASPRREYLERLRSLGFELPEFEVVAGESALAPDSLTRQRKLNNLRPWAWEPRSAAMMKPLRDRLPAGVCPPQWTETIRHLSSKVAQMEQWPNWEGGEGGEGAHLSYPCADPDAADRACRRLAETFGMDSALVKKADFSAAGRGLKIGGAGDGDSTGLGPRPNRVEWHPVVVEPWVKRVLDFSIQFEMEAGGLRRVGFLRQVIDERGRYRGTVWTPKFGRGLDSETARFLMETALPRYDVGAPFVLSLEEWLREAGYRGPVGVDAFLFRDAGGVLRHRIVCEVNPRHTMGRLTLELARRVAPGRPVRFEIVKKTGALAPESAVERDSKGRIAGGTLILNDPETAADWLAFLTVGESDPVTSPPPAGR